MWRAKRACGVAIGLVSIPILIRFDSGISSGGIGLPLPRMSLLAGPAYQPSCTSGQVGSGSVYTSLGILPGLITRSVKNWSRTRSDVFPSQVTGGFKILLEPARGGSFGGWRGPVGWGKIGGGRGLPGCSTRPGGLLFLYGGGLVGACRLVANGSPKPVVVGSSPTLGAGFLPCVGVLVSWVCRHTGGMDVTDMGSRPEEERRAEEQWMARMQDREPGMDPRTNFSEHHDPVVTAAPQNAPVPVEPDGSILGGEKERILGHVWMEQGMPGPDEESLDVELLAGEGAPLPGFSDPYDMWTPIGTPEGLRPGPGETW